MIKSKLFGLVFDSIEIDQCGLFVILTIGVRSILVLSSGKGIDLIKHYYYREFVRMQLNLTAQEGILMEFIF